MHSLGPVAGARTPAVDLPGSEDGASYTCPMHPEIVTRPPGFLPDLRDGPGADDHLGRMSRLITSCTDMSRRFWISLALTIPLVVLSMAEMVPRSGSSGGFLSGRVLGLGPASAGDARW